MTVVRIPISVKANARKNSVHIRTDGGLVVTVTAPAVEDKANKKVIEVLAEYFKKPKSRIVIAKGRKSRHKVVEIY